jgi:hypothetical protein
LTPFYKDITFSEGVYNITENKEIFKTFIFNTIDKSQTINEDILKTVRPSR